MRTDIARRIRIRAVAINDRVNEIKRAPFLRVEHRDALHDLRNIADELEEIARSAERLDPQE